MFLFDLLQCDEARKRTQRLWCVAHISIKRPAEHNGVLSNSIVILPSGSLYVALERDFMAASFISLITFPLQVAI